MVDEISVGEVSRRQDTQERRLDNLSEKFVLRREYDIDKRNTDARIVEVAGDIKETQGEVKQVQKQQVLEEKERQNSAAARRWQLFMAFASPVAAAIVTLLLIQGQTTP